MPAGDATEIGEKGINLSGGQKARIGLARAVYANTDVYLMDDPLSALDANVKKAIFENCFRNELYDKTRILVTHAIDLLPFVDDIIVMHEGKVLMQGPFNAIKDDLYMQKLLSYQADIQESNAAINADAHIVKAASELSDFSVDMGGKNDTDGKMMTKESEEVIEVGIKTYGRYFLDYYGGWCFIFTS